MIDPITAIVIAIITMIGLNVVAILLIIDLSDRIGKLEKVLKK